MILHEALAHAREERAWSRADLAAKLGVASETILRWENGHGPHTLHMVQMWADTLGHRLTTEPLTPLGGEG